MRKKFITLVLLVAFSLSIVSPGPGFADISTSPDNLTISDQTAATGPIDLWGDNLSEPDESAAANNPVPYINPTSAGLNLDDFTTENELRQAIIGDEKWLEQFPNGLFNFVGTQWQINEANKYLEIPVVRQGGTRGTVTVNFKAIDVSAEYGIDYVIRVYENSQRAEMVKNEDAMPLMQSIGNDTSINISNAAKEKTSEQSETPAESSSNTPPTPDGTSVNAGTLTVEATSGDTIAANTPSQTAADNTVQATIYADNTNQNILDDQWEVPADLPYTDLPRSVMTTVTSSGGTVKSLREAREVYLNQKSDRPDWKIADEGQVEDLKAAYDRYLNQVPGTETTLTFAEGEYIKYLYLVPLDDSISESEEQVMLALENPSNGTSRGEFYMGYANLIDNEAPEPYSFEITTPSVTARDGLATIIVKRFGGLQQNASITIGTEEDTAISGLDYEPGLGELFFTPGMSEQRVTVNILDNPARDTDRQFTIALDRTSPSVNPGAAAAVLTIPASPAPRALSAQSLDGENRSRLIAAETNAAAGQISTYGYSPSKGVWKVSYDDIINNAAFTIPDFKPAFFELADQGKGMAYSYRANWQDKVTQEITYDFGSLGGIESINMRYKNDAPYLSTDKRYSFSYNLANANTPDQKKEGLISKWTDCSIKNLFNSQSYSKYAGIKLKYYCPPSVDSNPQITDPQLVLKKYNIKIEDPWNENIKKFKIVYENNKPVMKLSEKKAYSPGSLYIKEVVSSVNNSQTGGTDKKAADVYRSDKIVFDIKWGAENEGGWRADYEGFVITYTYGQTAGAIYFDNPKELVLDADFFKMDHMWEATLNGTITIKPRFRQKWSLIQFMVDTDKGRMENMGSANYFYQCNWTDAYETFGIGDMIIDLHATGSAESRTPVWTYQGCDSANQYQKLIGNNIQIRPNSNNAWVDHIILANTYNRLNLGFSSNFIITANPKTYQNTIGMSSFKLDGKPYTSREAFLKDIKAAYDDTNKNPELEMEFQYITSGGSAFGELYGAELDVFIEDTLLTRHSYQTWDKGQTNYSFQMIPGTNGKPARFMFRGKPKELGWSLADNAAVILKGNGGYANSQPVTIDFLYNSHDGVILNTPDNKTLTGDKDHPISMTDANPSEAYTMLGVQAPTMVTAWVDMSPDTNNDGEVSPAEDNAARAKLESIRGKTIDDKTWHAIYDAKTYWNFFSYQPQHFDPSKIYYEFKDITRENTSEGSLSVDIWKKYTTVLNPTDSHEELWKNAQVYFLGKNVPDNNGDGRYEDRDIKYATGRSYLGRLVHNGITYNFNLDGNVHKPKQIIDLSSDLRPDTKTFKVTVGGEVHDFNKSANLLIEDKDTVFSYTFNGSSGLRPIDSLVRIYNEDDGLVYEEHSGPSQNNYFTYKINTLQKHLKKNYYMTIATIVQGGNASETKIFPEVRVGFFFAEKLDPFSLLASYQALHKTSEMLGDLNNNYDLGLKIDIDDGITSDLVIDDKPISHDSVQIAKRGYKIVTFGFKKTFKEKVEEKLVIKDTGGGSSDDEDGENNDEDNQDGNGDTDSDDDPFAGINGMLNEETDGKDHNGVKNAVAAEADKGEEVKSGGGDFLDFEISLALTWEKNWNVKNSCWEADHYFRSLVIMAKGTPKKTFKREKTFITPIGVPVTITFEVKGDAVLVVGFEKPTRDSKYDPLNAKYRLDYDEKTDTGGFRPDNYMVYSQFNVYPTVVLSATADADLVSITLEGKAVFDLRFTIPIHGTNTSKGTGGLTLSSTLKAQSLCWEKEWSLYKGKRIEFFNYGGSAQQAMLSALSNPYQNYQYEKLSTIEDEDIISRDYLSDRSTWNSTHDGMLGDVHFGYEVELQKGCYPYPQTRLISINENSTLMLFIDDDPSRDARNRACLMYSIISDTSSTPPAALDNDGTWDESPNAFVIGNRILITWSDADRVFTNTDTVKDLLKTMNISGIWFDTQTGTFSQKFAITKTVTSDNYGDMNPMISYNPNTGRLMVYYNKIDYEDRWQVSQNISSSYDEMEEIPGPLYGDIVNGYNVITYRYADYDPAQGDFVWNKTYAPEEMLDSAQFYGQRFLDLKPLASIHEEEHEVAQEVTITGDSGCSTQITVPRTGTTQTVEPYQGLDDPRIVEMDLTTHDEMAAFAYVMDFDADLKTIADQQLYLQTYDYVTNTFLSPIQITNNSVQNTHPRFVQLSDATYLYWLEDGNIVYTSISDLFKSGKLKEVAAPGSGKSFYIIDKSDSLRESYIATAVDHTNRIDKFEIASKDDTVYVLWPEDRVNYKDGINPDDPGANDPVNLHKEKQIFVACKVVNGTTDFPWTKPIQVTSEAGANYSDLSFIVMADEYFQAAYSKYGTRYNNDTQVYTDSNSVRNLGFRAFRISNDLRMGDIATDIQSPHPGDLVKVSAVLSNTGLKAVKNPAYQFYVNTNGSNYFASEWYQNTADEPVYILGASDKAISDCFFMPDSLDGIDEMIMGFRVKDEAGQLLTSKEKKIVIKPELHIQVKNSLVSQNQASINLKVTNSGNKVFNDTYTISHGNKVLSSAVVQIAAGEQKNMELELDITGLQFGSLYTAEDGSQYDSLTLDIKFGEFDETADLIRRASPEACTEMQQIASLSISSEGTLLQDKGYLAIQLDKYRPLNMLIKKSSSPEENAGLHDLKTVWSSSRPDIVRALPDGRLLPVSSGTATITASVQPISEETISYADGTFKTFDTSYKLPEALAKKISFTVNVSNFADTGGSDHSSSLRPPAEQKPAKPNPASVTVQAVGKLENGQLNLTVDDQSFTRAAGQTSGFIIVRSAGGAGQVRELAVNLSPGNLQAITQSQVQGMVIETSAGNITLDRKTLDTMAAAGSEQGGSIALSLNDDSIDVALKGGRVEVNQLNGGSILLSVPYSAQPGIDANCIVAYDMSDQAAPKVVRTSVYQPTQGMISFKTGKTGRFTIGYNKIEFTDDLGWAENYINFLAARQILSGIAPGIFAKDKALTRAEFVTMLARLSGEELPADVKAVLSDVDANAWYAGYVQWAYKNKIVNGTSPTTFSPEKFVSREEMAVMLSSYLTYARMTLPPGVNTGFADQGNLSPWSANAVNALKAAGIMNGTGNNYFEPQKLSNRAEAAKVLSDILRMFV